MKYPRSIIKPSRHDANVLVSSARVYIANVEERTTDLRQPLGVDWLVMIVFVTSQTASARNLIKQKQRVWRMELLTSIDLSKYPSDDVRDDYTSSRHKAF